ncbi:MAG: AAA family ATPase [Pseudonocardiaceae bacterium]|nr:AAA family ATPase [Pseudonocardiaceae bacterium]
MIVRDGSSCTLGTQKAVALAGYLGIRGEPIGREQLATVLWAESTHEQARRSLRGELARLRSALPAGAVGASRLNIWLDPSVVEIDVRRFWALLAHGRDDEAVELYRGPLLEGLDLRNAEPFERWLHSERHLLEIDYVGVLRRLIVAAWDRGDASIVLRWARRALRCQPLAEEFYVHAMEAAEQLDDRATVLTTYRQLEDVLQGELGIGPGGEARAVARRGSNVDDTEGPLDVSSLGRRPGEYVGHEREQALLRELIRRSGAECGSVAFVHGPAGAGKTSLLWEVLGRRRAVWCRAQRSASTIAYYPIATGLREHLSRWGVPSVDDLWLREAARVCPELSRATPSPSLGVREDKIRLLEGLSATLVGAAGRGGVVIFDDVQWADADTTAVLEDLIQRLPRLRVSIVVVARDDHDLKSTGMAEVLAATARSGYLTEVVVDELSGGQILQLIRQSCHDLSARAPAGWLEEFAETVYEVIGGNPFYALECARLALDGSQEPPVEPVVAVRFGVRDIVRARLAALPRHLQQVAEAATVVGEPLSPDVLARVLKVDPWEFANHLDALASRGVLTMGRDGLGFVHDLVAEAIYESIPSARRQLLHERAALALAHAHATGIDNVGGRIAAHLEAAGRKEEAIPYHERAAEAAHRAHAPQMAIYHYQRLRELLPRDQHVPLLLQLGGTLSYGASGESETVYREALKLASEQGDGHAQARCHLALGALLRRRSDLSGSRRALTEALRRFEVYGDAEGMEQALEALTYAYIQQGQLAAASSSASQAAALARNTGRLANLGRATLSRGIAHLYGGEYESALRCCEAARGLAKDTGDELSEAEALRYLSAVYGIDGRLGTPEQAWSTAEQAIEICSRLGHRTGLARAADGAGGAYLLQGDWERALECYVAALHLKDIFGYVWGFDAVIYRIGYTLLVAGENHGARRALEHAEILSRRLNAPYWLCRTLMAAAELALRDGDWVRASPLATASRELAKRIEHREFMLQARALVRGADTLGSGSQQSIGFKGAPQVSGRFQSSRSLQRIGHRATDSTGTVNAHLPDLPQVLEVPVRGVDAVITWLEGVVDRQLRALPEECRGEGAHSDPTEIHNRKSAPPP